MATRIARSAPVSIALSTVLLLSAGSALSDAGRSPEAGSWWRVTDGSLTLVSDASPEEARQVLELLTSLRRVVGEFLFRRPVELAAPVTVLLFSEASGYEPYRLYQRDGQYLGTPFEGLVVVNGGADRRPMRRIAAHEYLHALVAGAGLDLPLWLAEGLAEYYSTARVAGDRLVLGEPAAELASRLRGRPFLPFEEHLTLSSRSSGYLADPEADLFYAQSWLLVHYLLSRPEGAGRLTDLVRRIEAGQPVGAALDEAMGYDAAELDRRLRRYLNAPALPRLDVPLEPGPAAAVWGGRVLEPAELACQMAILSTEQLRWERTPERLATARRWLDLAIAAAPGDGDVVALAARYREMAGDRETAAALYRRSVYLDARQGRTYAYYARFLLDEGEGVEEDLGEARLLVDRALELAPSHPWLEELERRLGRAPRPGLVVEGSSRPQP